MNAAPSPSNAQFAELRLPPRPKFHADVPLRWGLVLGLLLAAVFEAIYQTRFYLRPGSGLAMLAGNMVVTAAVLVQVARTVRRRDAHVATLSRIFFYCILTGFAAGLVLSLHELVFNLYIDPDYSVRLLTTQRDAILAMKGNPGINEKAWAESLEANRLGIQKVLAKGNDPAEIVIGTMGSVLLYCGLYGLVMGVIFRWRGSWQGPKL